MYWMQMTYLPNLQPTPTRQLLVKTLLWSVIHCVNLSLVNDEFATHLLWKISRTTWQTLGLGHLLVLVFIFYIIVFSRVFSTK